MGAYNQSPVRMPLILARQIPDVESVRIIEIFYQRYKLSDTEYALTV